MTQEQIEGERVAAEIRAKIDAAIPASPPHPDAKTVDDFDTIEEFLDWVGGGSAER